MTLIITLTAHLLSYRLQSSEALLTVKTRPQRSAGGYGPTPVHSAAPDIWEGGLAVGRAKVYMVGNPILEGVATAGMPDPQLQVWLSSFY